jgi:hypothetical protein
MPAIVVATHTNISRTCPTEQTCGSKDSTHTNIVLVVMKTGRLDVGRGVVDFSCALPTFTNQVPSTRCTGGVLDLLTMLIKPVLLTIIGIINS